MGRRALSGILAVLLFFLPVMTLAEEQTESSNPPEGQTLSGEQSVALPGLYSGLLHSHTTFSDGEYPPEALAETAGEKLDFLGLTDHSDSLSAEEWASYPGGAEDSVVLRGYEISWPETMLLGHIGVFGTENPVSWQEDAYDDYRTGLENFYAVLAADPEAVGQFQHPGDYYGKFKNFAYDSGADRVISLLEVACEGETFFDAYTAALDKGWHVSPTWGGNTHGDLTASAGRTVVRMDALTEENLKSALKNRRTYATADADLQILYSVDGHEMGAIVPRRQIGPTAEIDMTLFDPTDEGVGIVEIVGPGGAVAAAVSVDANPERITLSLNADRDYYFLRVIQPDGDIALTAPVWIRQTERAGIAAFTCDTAVPVQGSPVDLTLGLYNEENAPLEISRLELYLDEKPVLCREEPFSVMPGTAAEVPLTYTHMDLGEGELTVRVTAKMEDDARNYAQTLLLSARRKDMLTQILVDGSHANAGLDRLSELDTLARRQNMTLIRSEEPLTGEKLADCALLIILSPEEDFSPEFLETVREYTAYGGSVMVCADDPARAGALNLLLGTLGATASFGRELPEHRPGEFNREDPLCAGIPEGQYFRLERGCAVLPGNGTWLVKGQDILAARENLPGGGTLLVFGSLMPVDEALEEPDYLWEEPYANRTILRSLLGDTPNPVALSTIRQVREGEPGEIYRIRGYVTASTIPGKLYVQDTAGGMEISPFRGDVGLGRPVEVTGTLIWQAGEPVLHPISWEVPDQPGYRYQPQSLNCRQAQDGDSYGGLLVMVSGICMERTLSDKGIAREFVLRDATGKRLRVVIGENLVSPATGRNDLHTILEKDKEIWAIGILRTDETGKTFLQVRSCDEVVAVAPNPYTGDGMGLWPGALLMAAAGLLFLCRKGFRKM